LTDREQFSTIIKPASDGHLMTVHACGWVFTIDAATQANLASIPKHTAIYIDSDLGQDIKGEIFAKELFEQGYHELYLATGYRSSDYDLKQYPWFKGVTDKPGLELLS
jgi:hypothetical protein